LIDIDQNDVIDGERGCALSAVVAGKFEWRKGRGRDQLSNSNHDSRCKAAW